MIMSTACLLYNDHTVDTYFWWSVKHANVFIVLKPSFPKGWLNGSMLDISWLVSQGYAPSSWWSALWLWMVHGYWSSRDLLDWYGFQESGFFFGDYPRCRGMAMDSTNCINVTWGLWVNHGKPYLQSLSMRAHLKHSFWVVGEGRKPW